MQHHLSIDDNLVLKRGGMLLKITRVAEYECYVPTKIY